MKVLMQNTHELRHTVQVRINEEPTQVQETQHD